MSRVSVLMAVYNAAPYLRRSLDSLLNQQYSDIEVICIDDASTDSSWEILQEYAAKDSRIRTLRQAENGGQAKARNRGLRYVTGNYVAMLDADDWLAPDAISRVMDEFEAHPKTDAVLLKLMQWYEESGEVVPFANRTEKRLFTGEEALRLSLDWSIHGVYVVRAEIHTRYPFDESCRLFSDDNTTRIHFLHSREVRLSEGEYYYRKHAASCTHAITMARFDYLEANFSMKRQLEAEGVSEELLNCYEHHRWLNVVGMYWFYYQYQDRFTEKEKEEIFCRIDAMLQTIEAERVPLRQRMKLGYYPFRSFKLFRFQEEFYFRLRNLLKRK